MLLMQKAERLGSIRTSTLWLAGLSSRGSSSSSSTSSSWCHCVDVRGSRDEEVVLGMNGGNRPRVVPLASVD